jgi:hypothetical protein
MMRGAPARILMVLVVIAGIGGVVWRYLPSASGPSPEDLADAALHAPTVGQQTVAAARLADYGDGSRDTLRRVFSETTQPDVQIVCVQGLAGIWDYESMDLFLDLAERGPPQVRGRAAQAVMRMTGRQRPFLSDAPEEQRRILIGHMRADWDEIKRASPEKRNELIRRLRESHEKKS